MSTLKLIATRNFIALNKDIARAIGLNEAIVLGALCSESVYCDGRGLTEDGFFPFSIELLQEETTLGRKSQDTAIANLVSAGLVEQKNFGIPNKRHFRIVEEAVESLLLEQTSLDSADTQVCIVPHGQTNSKKECNKDSKKVEEEVKEEVEPFADVPQVTESNQPSQDEMIHYIIKSWNAQKNIRTTIDRIVPMSKRYNDTFLTISQFGYDAFIYQILCLDQNAFFEQWQPFYDWFCDPNNFIKVYEGNYRSGKPKEVDRNTQEYWDSL